MRCGQNPHSRDAACAEIALLSLACVTWHFTRAWELTEHPFRSACFALPTYPQKSEHKILTFGKQPVASALLLCNCLRRHGRRFRFSRRLTFHQLYRRSKIRPLQATRNGPQNALILMRLLYNKELFLSSGIRAAFAPCSPNYYINSPFTVCSHIHIFAFSRHSRFLAYPCNLGIVIFIYSILTNFGWVSCHFPLILCKFIAIFCRTILNCNFYLPYDRSRLFIFYAFFNFFLCNSCTISRADFLRLDILHKFVQTTLHAPPHYAFFLHDSPFYLHFSHFLPFILSAQ